MSVRTLGDTPFAERVRTAAAAGFDAIGLSVESYLAAHRDGMDDRTMRTLLDDHGLAVTEVEFLSDWLPAGPGPGPGAGSVKERTAFHIARTFGASRVNAGLFDKAPPGLVAERFAALCERAGGLAVALEFMPFGGIPDLRAAWEAVRLADSSRAGLLIDVWHWVRAGTTADALSPVPPGRVLAVQLCDVGPEALPEARYESLHHRLLPGSGSNHARDVLTVLRRHGAGPQMTAEVMSDDLLAGGPRAAARAAFAATHSVLVSVYGGWPVS
ncbi:sugar phosphate isomerase/epimerase family protein [Streptomyces aidingensis]|nr:TIM barrel protein [Streptomyces aidingensis]